MIGRIATEAAIGAAFILFLSLALWMAGGMEQVV